MRLDEVQAHFGDRVRIEWRSFLLRDGPRTGSHDDFVAYTAAWRRIGDLEPRATFVPWSSDDPQPTSSVPAQVAATLVARRWPERARTYRHGLFTAYFTENRTISEPDVLADVAERCGIDADAFTDALAVDHRVLADEVRRDHETAVGNGITAVPTVDIGGVLPVPGAQDVATYIQWIERLLAARS